MQKWKWGCFLNEGFTNEWQEGYIETTPDAGIPFRRLRFTDIQDIVSGTISLTHREYLDIMSWYKHEIKQGTIPFLFYDCRVKSERIARLTMNKPKFNRWSNRWNVAVTFIFDSESFVEEGILVANKIRPLEIDGKLVVADIKRYL